jgi:hypothetical protein
MKIEIDLPIKAVDYVDQNIEVIGDNDGIQLNIIYDGMITHMLRIDRDFNLTLDNVEGIDEKQIFEYDLLQEPSREINRERGDYQVPKHLRGEIDIDELKKDFDLLRNPVDKNGGLNMCYSDGHFAKSLVEKYGKSIPELENILKQHHILEVRKQKIFDKPDSF